MRPLVLREIAEALGLHESTISRVTTQKYMPTPLGIFELKYFFGSHVSTETGGDCFGTAIRALIKQFVAAEDGKKPLSDNRISDILAQQGIQVARRTVAKYREAMHIQPANLRKSICKSRSTVRDRKELLDEPAPHRPPRRDHARHPRLRHAKLERINRHFDHVIDVNVVMTVEKLDQKIEANVHLSGKDIHVQATTADMYAAIDGLIDKLDRQVLKHKERFHAAPCPGHQAHHADRGLE